MDAETSTETRILREVYHREALRRFAEGGRQYQDLNRIVVQIVEEMKEGLQPERYIAAQQS